MINLLFLLAAFIGSVAGWKAMGFIKRSNRKKYYYEGKWYTHYKTTADVDENGRVVYHEKYRKDEEKWEEN